MPRTDPAPAATRRSARLQARTSTSPGTPSISITCLATARRSSPASHSLPLAPHLLRSAPSPQTSEERNPSAAANPPPSRPPPLQRRLCRQVVLKALEAHPHDFASLIAELHPASGHDRDHPNLRKRIEEALEDESLPLPVAPADLISWFFSVVQDPAHSSVPPLVLAAVALRQQQSRRRRTQRRNIAGPLFLYKSVDRKDAFAHTIGVFHLPRLPDGHEYPPRRHWVARDAASAKKWGAYMASTPLPDKRKPTRRLFAPIVIDKSRLQMIIPAEVSCIIKDAATGDVVFAVFRNFCGVLPILRWAKDIVRLANTTRKSVRVRVHHLGLASRQTLNSFFAVGRRRHHRSSWFLGRCFEPT